MDIDTYLRDRSISEAQLASLTGTTGATINRLRHGKMRASPELAMRIEAATDGAVSASDLSPVVRLARETAAKAA
jgi:DNA-binding transcriptional regulator YdaS (Cro superfamily)